MNQILLKNDEGESVVASVVRYFKYNNESYMLYTLNEVDTSNYIKLYGIKLEMDPLGNMIGTMIEDSVWTDVVALIKEMVKPVLERVNANFQDINQNSISNINLVSKRVFKINKEMADLLAINIDTENDGDNTETTRVNPTINENINEPRQEQQQIVQPDQQNTIDYKQLYEQELRNIEQMNIEMKNLKTKISTIENLLKG